MISRRRAWPFNGSLRNFPIDGRMRSCSAPIGARAPCQNACLIFLRTLLTKTLSLTRSKIRPPSLSLFTPETVPSRSGWDANDNRSRLHVPRNHGAGTDDGAAPNPNAGQDDGI